MDAAVATPVLTVTARAIETIVGLRAAEDGDDALALWVEVTGSNGADFTYDLVFEPMRAPTRPTSSPSSRG